MTGDFVALHPEEFVSIVDGLFFSGMLTEGIPLIFLPLIVFLLGISIFVWIQRLEKEQAWSQFLLWLISSSIIIFSVFHSTSITVELNPVVLVNKDAAVSLGGMQQEGNRFFYTVKNVSGISALLAIPDKIASYMFYFLDQNLIRKLAGNVNTIPINNITCNDPRHLAGIANSLVVAAVLELDKETSIEDFKNKVNAFKGCYASDFKGNFKSGVNVSFNFDPGTALRNAWAGASAGAIVGGAIGSFAGPGAFATALIGAGIGAFTALVPSVVSFSAAKCEDFLNAYKKILDNMLEKCQEFNAIRPESKPALEAAALGCIRGEISTAEGGNECEQMKQNTLSAMEQADNAALNVRLGNDQSRIKNTLSSIITKVGESLYSATYFSFNLKLNSLAKGQGVVLALFLGAFPFIALLSIVPSDKHFINWPLLYQTGVAYFLVKLWLPAIYFVINIAVHTFATLATGAGAQ